MKKVILRFILAGLSVGSLLQGTPRALAGEDEADEIQLQQWMKVANAPFDVPYPAQMHARIVTRETPEKYTARGIQLFIGKLTDPKQMLQRILASNYDAIPFQINEEFYDRAKAIFSHPFVSKAEFCEWKDQKGQVVIPATVFPEEMEATLADVDGNEVIFKSGVVRNHFSSPRYLLTFSYQFGKSLKVTAEYLKEVLEYICHRTFPSWRVEQFVDKLSRPSLDKWITVSLPSPDQPDEQHYPRIFEYRDMKGDWIKERYDPETGLSLKFLENHRGQKQVKIGDGQNRETHLKILEIDLNSDSKFSRGNKEPFIWLSAFSTEGKRVVLSDEKLGEYLEIFTGVSFPPRYVTWINRKLVQEARWTWTDLKVNFGLDFQLTHLLRRRNK